MNTAVKQTLTKFIHAGDTVILGISGGPDSVFLLDQCIKLYAEIPFMIIVAHVNHNLRGADSLKDQQFVKKLADRHKLPFETIKLKPFKKGNIEEQSRNQRYLFFGRLLKKYRARWIITAHHRDDNVETVLFNLIRGSYLEGLTGMDVENADRKILRPLLATSKQDILDQLKKEKADYRTDKSNFDLRLSRNLLRHKIIPMMKKINSNFENTFLANVGLLKETSTLINGLTDEWLKKNKKPALDKFMILPLILQKNVLNKMYRNIHGNTDSFNRKHLEQILTMLHKNSAGLKKEFGPGHFIAIKKDPKNTRHITIIEK